MKSTLDYILDESSIPNITLIKKWFESAASLDYKTNDIFVAIDKKDYDSLKEQLVKSPNLAFERDFENRTPLMYSAIIGDKVSFDIIIESLPKEERFSYISSISAPFNWNILYYAVLGGSTEIFNAANNITQHDLNCYRDIFIWSPFDYLMLNEKTYFDFRADNECYDWITWQLENSYMTVNVKKADGTDESPIKIAIAGIDTKQVSMKFKSEIRQAQSISEIINELYATGHNIITPEDDKHKILSKAAYKKCKVWCNIDSSPKNILYLLDKYHYIYSNFYFPYTIALYSLNLKIVADLIRINKSIYENMFNRNGTISDSLIGEIIDKKSIQEKYGSEWELLYVVACKGLPIDEIPDNVSPSELRELFGL